MNYGEFQSTCIQEDVLNGRKDISLQPMERQHDGTDLHTTACGRSPTGTDRYSHADEGESVRSKEQQREISTYWL